MTSNLGMDTKSIGFNENENLVFDRIKSFLGIELFNRISEVVQFGSLNEEDIRKIIVNKLTDIVERKNLNKVLSTDIVNKIINRCDYKEYGARKVEKIVDEELKNMYVSTSK